TPSALTPLPLRNFRLFTVSSFVSGFGFRVSSLEYRVRMATNGFPETQTRNPKLETLNDSYHRPHQNHVQRPNSQRIRQLKLYHTVLVAHVEQRGRHDVEVCCHWSHQGSTRTRGQSYYRHHRRVDAEWLYDQR